MSGVTAEVMKENISKIESMVSEYINGQMVEYMKVIGIQVNKMAMENILSVMEHTK